MNLLPSSYFLGTGKVLLLGSLGYGMLQMIRDDEDARSVIEASVTATVVLSFYQIGLSQIESLGSILSRDLESLKRGFDLGTYLTDFIDRNGLTEGDRIIENLKVGLWSIPHLIVEFLFVVSGLFLQAAYEVLWKLLLLVFPVLTGLYPVFPGLLKNGVTYGIELMLWMPLLAITEIVAGDVSKSILSRPGVSGLTALAIELVAAVLTFTIPSIAHRMVCGAMSADSGGAGAHTVAKKWAAVSLNTFRWMKGSRP